jgi:hypothetical protein
MRVVIPPVVAPMDGTDRDLGHCLDGAGALFGSMVGSSWRSSLS